MVFPEVIIIFLEAFRERYNLDPAAHVLQDKSGHSLVLPGFERLERGYDPRDSYLTVEILLIIQLVYRVGDEPFQLFSEFSQRMSCDIES